MFCLWDTIKEMQTKIIKGYTYSVIFDHFFFHFPVFRLLFYNLLFFLVLLDSKLWLSRFRPCFFHPSCVTFNSLVLLFLWCGSNSLSGLLFFFLSFSISCSSCLGPCYTRATLLVLELKKLQFKFARVVLSSYTAATKS